MKLLWGGFTLTALGMTVQTGVQVAGGNLGPLISPEALLVEHGLMFVLGAWGLQQIIAQGKRMATREDVTKLRDDTTAILLEYQTRVDGQFQGTHDRIDSLMERRKNQK